eukprot:8891118-Prorocentrum_lima.AAC.1
MGREPFSQLHCRFPVWDRPTPCCSSVVSANGRGKQKQRMLHPMPRITPSPPVAGPIQLYAAAPYWFP